MDHRSGNPIYDTPIMRQIAAQADQLKPALRKVAEYILRHPFRAATLNIEEIAQVTQTSTAAVNRLANAVGAHGFTGLRGALMSNLLLMASPHDSLHNAVAANPEDGFTLYQQITLGCSQMEHLALLNSHESFEAIVQQLLDAQRVFVVGFAESHNLAAIAAAGLISLRDNVCLMSMDDGVKAAAHRVATICRSDTVLILALPDYPRESVRLAQYAYELGATVLSLTDAPGSPLSAVSAHAIYIPSSHPVLGNSGVPMLGMIEAVVSAVAMRAPPNAAAAQRQADQVLGYLLAEGGPLATEQARKTVIAGPTGDAGDKCP
jgi:DNA-binding MurR/RpiR family transcriptional regulator